MRAVRNTRVFLIITRFVADVEPEGTQEAWHTYPCWLICQYEGRRVHNSSLKNNPKPSRTSLYPFLLVQCSLWTSFQVGFKRPKFVALNHSSPLSIHHSNLLLPTPSVSNSCVPVPIVAFGMHVCSQGLVASSLASSYGFSAVGTDPWLTVIHLVNTDLAICLVTFDCLPWLLAWLIFVIAESKSIICRPVHCVQRIGSR